MTPRLFPALQVGPVETRFQSSASQNAHYHAKLQMAFAALGMLQMFVTAIFNVWTRAHLNTVFHLTMYAGFFVCGAIIFMTTRRKCVLPKGTDYCAAFAAYTLEGQLFYFHTSSSGDPFALIVGELFIIFVWPLH